MPIRFIHFLVFPTYNMIIMQKPLVCFRKKKTSCQCIFHEKQPFNMQIRSNVFGQSSWSKGQIFLFFLCLVITMLNISSPKLSRYLQLTNPTTTSTIIKTEKGQRLLYNHHHDDDDDHKQQALSTETKETIETIETTIVKTSTTNTTNNNNNNDDDMLLWWCPDTLVAAGAKSSSASIVWYELQHRILEASYMIHPDMNKFNDTMMKSYTDWVKQLFSFYTPERLRRTIMNPAPPKTIIQLLKLANEIKRHNNNVNMIQINNNNNNNNNNSSRSTSNNNEEDRSSIMTKKKKRKLRILVLGGSVTAGQGCVYPALMELQQKGSKKRDCAWSIRLEKLLNDVIFNGEQIVRINNMASGGMSSEWGALILDYRLFANSDDIPDVIISAYSANDSREPNPPERIYREMEHLVQAANNLQPCNNNAPLVILLDDLYGDMPYLASRHTSKIYMLSTWYNVMAINYPNTVKYKVFTEKIGKVHPLLTSPFNVHNGVGMHIGLSWTILFNIINSIVNVCNDVAATIRLFEEPYHNNNILDDDNNNNKNDYVDPNTYYFKKGQANNDNNNNNNNNNNKDGSIGSNNNNNNHNHNSNITAPSIDRKLLPNLKNGEPSFQHFGFIGEGDGNSASVKKAYQLNVKKNKEICNPKINTTTTNNTNNTNNQNQKKNIKCSYAWIIDRSIKFSLKEQLHNEMNKIIIKNDGWKADGYPIRQPRTGWYSQKENATFSILINNTIVDTNIVLILSMKSYDTQWLHSKLAISTTVIKQQKQQQQQQQKQQTNDSSSSSNSTTNISTTASSNSSTNNYSNIYNLTNIDWDNNNNTNNSISYIDGYHTTKTSVHFPHKIPITDKGGAKAGDSIILNVKLIGGSVFKIAGLAFCSF